MAPTTSTAARLAFHLFPPSRLAISRPASTIRVVAVGLLDIKVICAGACYQIVVSVTIIVIGDSPPTVPHLISCHILCTVILGVSAVVIGDSLHVGQGKPRCLTSR